MLDVVGKTHTEEQMKETFVVRVDNKGRITLPLKMRQEFHIETGDVFFVLPENAGLYLVKAENPFEILTKHSREEVRQGRSIPLIDFVRDHISKTQKNKIKIFKGSKMEPAKKAVKKVSTRQARKT
jgi:bifunctional DNA-binding transcriptional regulator/antitoxin component of YhaV-PrlF toxin-antitoxin module